MDNQDTLAQALRVGINAHFKSGIMGGVEQALIGLAGALSTLDDGDEEYVFLTIPGENDWLKPFIGGNCHLVESSAQYQSSSIKARARRLISSRTPRLARFLQNLPVAPWERPVLQHSDGTLEAQGVDLIHFPYQAAFTTNLPSIYQPWDLQHIHLSQFFTARDLRIRQTTYPGYCNRAERVVVATQWVKKDIEQHLGVPASKTAVIPMAPPTGFYPVPSEEDIHATLLKFDLPEKFLFYPAQTFRHKNHHGLIEALALLKTRDHLIIPVICSGRTDSYGRDLEHKARDMGVGDQIRFVGHVTPIELQSLYRLTDGLVFPTLFEGWGLPITEAFLAGIPVASSDVTCLPEQAGDAALFFDPASVLDMATAMRRLWSDASLRNELITKGSERVRKMTWDEVARNYRALYRQIGKRPLDAEDTKRLAKMLGG